MVRLAALAAVVIGLISWLSVGFDSHQSVTTAPHVRAVPIPTVHLSPPTDSLPSDRTAPVPVGTLADQYHPGQYKTQVVQGGSECKVDTATQHKAVGVGDILYLDVYITDLWIKKSIGCTDFKRVDEIAS